MPQPDDSWPARTGEAGCRAGPSHEAAGACARQAMTAKPDDGVSDCVDATGYLSTPDTWPDETVDTLGGMRGRVLDVGCGAGDASYLATIGCEVLGLDPSPGAVEVCRRRGVDVVVGRLGDAPDCRRESSTASPCSGTTSVGWRAPTRRRRIFGGSPIGACLARSWWGRGLTYGTPTIRISSHITCERGAKGVRSARSGFGSDSPT
jgi:Methyltransferase domain